MALEFTVDLLYDGDQQLRLDGVDGVEFSTASVIAGEVAGNPDDSSNFYWDDIELERNAVNLLGNSSFEDPVGGITSGGPPVSVGNWSRKAVGSSIVEVVSSPVASGTKAARSRGTTSGGAYWYQDLDFVPAEPFTLRAMIRPQEGSQVFELVWDWDRGSAGSTAGAAVLDLRADGTTLDVWGANGAAPALPYGTFTLVELVFNTAPGPRRPTLGGLGFGLLPSA